MIGSFVAAAARRIRTYPRIPKGRREKTKGLIDAAGADREVVVEGLEIGHVIVQVGDDVDRRFLLGHGVESGSLG